MTFDLDISIAIISLGMLVEGFILGWYCHRTLVDIGGAVKWWRQWRASRATKSKAEGA